MGLPESYVNNVGNLGKVLDDIKSAGVPERVTFEFLKTLGFKSSNDRPIISVLKGIGFLDQNGTPTDAYRAFRDPHNGPKILARALKEAYSDLYMANTRAHDLPLEKLKGVIATKTSKGDGVVRSIAATFKALSKAADFSDSETEPQKEEVKLIKKEQTGLKADDLHKGGEPLVTTLQEGNPTFHYNIQIHLPTTTDITVYNAIFKSLKEHLL